jgi:hypothetical protein
MLAIMVAPVAQANATGKFSVDKTNIDANVAPPPTPATPKELIITLVLLV